MCLAHTSREYSSLEKISFGKDLQLRNTNLIICYYNEQIQLNKSDTHTLRIIWSQQHCSPHGLCIITKIHTLKILYMDKYHRGEPNVQHEMST